MATKPPTRLHVNPLHMWRSSIAASIPKDTAQEQDFLKHKANAGQPFFSSKWHLSSRIIPPVRAIIWSDVIVSFQHLCPQSPPEAKHLPESQFFAVPARGTVAFFIISLFNIFITASFWSQAYVFTVRRLVLVGVHIIFVDPSWIGNRPVGLQCLKPKRVLCLVLVQVFVQLPCDKIDLVATSSITQNRSITK